MFLLLTMVVLMAGAVFFLIFLVIGGLLSEICVPDILLPFFLKVFSFSKDHIREKLMDNLNAKIYFSDLLQGGRKRREDLIKSLREKE